MCAPGPGLRRGGRSSSEKVAPEGAGDRLVAPVRGEWEDAARQFPVTGELIDNGHKVERKEAGAVLKEKCSLVLWSRLSREVCPPSLGVYETSLDKAPSNQD